MNKKKIFVQFWSCNWTFLRIFLSILTRKFYKFLSGEYRKTKHQNFGTWVEQQVLHCLLRISNKARYLFLKRILRKLYKEKKIFYLFMYFFFLLLERSSKFSLNKLLLLLLCREWSSIKYFTFVEKEKKIFNVKFKAFQKS